MSTILQTDSEEIQDHIRKLAQNVVSEISGLDPSHSKELLGVLVSEVFRAATEQERREKRRQRQAEGIAAAKAKGKKFGRPARPMPENFHEIHQAWREGKLVLQDAADACGMPQSTFYDKAIAYERTVGIT